MVIATATETSLSITRNYERLDPGARQLTFANVTWPVHNGMRAQNLW